MQQEQSLGSHTGAAPIIFMTDKKEEETMRKQFKKALSMVLSAAMVLALGSGIELKQADAAQKDKACDIKLTSQIDNWGGTVLGKADGDGEYHLVYEGSGSNITVFCLDIAGLSSAVASAGALSVSDFTMKLDGADYAVDNTKLLFGDIEDNGNYRIEIYNEWGTGTADDSPIDISKLTFTQSMEISFTLTGTGWGEKSKDRPTTVTSGDPDTILAKDGIHAYLTYQTRNKTNKT